jgi:pre-mRNA-splicing factor CWC22
MEISDQTGDKEKSMRRQIYLTIMSSLDYEECAHKLLKTMGEGNEV